MSTKTIILIIVAVLLAAAIVVVALVTGGPAKAPVSSTGPAVSATSSQTLGGQIYQNVSPQSAVPQSLPQVNPFAQ